LAAAPAPGARPLRARFRTILSLPEDDSIETETKTNDNTILTNKEAQQDWPLSLLDYTQTAA